MGLAKYKFSGDAGEACRYVEGYWGANITSNLAGSLYQNWIKSFRYYYGYMYDGMSNNSGLSSLGENLEFIGYTINHFRNIIKNTLGILFQNKIEFDAIAESQDIEVSHAAEIANDLLEHFFYNMGFMDEAYRAAEQGMIFGTSFLEVFWETNKELIGMDKEGFPVYKGGPALKAFTPLDIRLEPFLEKYSEQNWITCRTFINRFDLLEEYPEFEKEILSCPAIRDVQLADPYLLNNDEIIWLKVIYHVSTPALPVGRVIKYINVDSILDDTFNEDPTLRTENPYISKMMRTGNPFVCFRPDVRYGSAFGHTVAFDLLPLQEQLNLINSMKASMLSAFGTQNIVGFRGTNFDYTEIGNGLRIFEVDFKEGLPNGGIPQPLNLLSINPSVIDEEDRVIKNMETISGVNSAIRGNPQQGIEAASAIALLTSQALNYNTTLEKSFTGMCEEIATRLIQLCAKFMPTENVLNIIGKNKKYYIKDFKAENLKYIKQVRISSGNYLSKTLSGRLTMADQLLNSNQITPSTYMEVVNTGQIKNTIDEKASTEDLIRYENQQMQEGKIPEVDLTHNHIIHIEEHKDLLNIPEILADPNLANCVRQHMQKHMQYFVVLGQDNPQLLAMITDSPIPPPTPIGQPPQPVSPQPQSHMVPPGNGGMKPPHPGMGKPMGRLMEAKPMPSPAQTPEQPKVKRAAQEMGDQQALAQRANEQAQNISNKVTGIGSPVSSGI